MCPARTLKFRWYWDATCLLPTSFDKRLLRWLLVELETILTRKHFNLSFLHSLQSIRHDQMEPFLVHIIFFLPLTNLIFFLLNFFLYLKIDYRLDFNLRLTHLQYHKRLELGKLHTCVWEIVIRKKTHSQNLICFSHFLF